MLVYPWDCGSLSPRMFGTLLFRDTVYILQGLPFLNTNQSQCDEKRPTCGNCKKSGRECPGYPDEFDLVFRDENKAMARKAKKTTVLIPSRSSTGGSSSSHTSPHL